MQNDNHKFKISKIKKILRRLKLRPKKHFGQNFLVDEEVLKKIVETADLKKEDVILEAGAGLGNLTEELAEKAKLVVAVEKDRNLADFLKEKFKDWKNVKIVEGDILKNFQFPTLWVVAQRGTISKKQIYLNLKSLSQASSRDEILNLNYKIVANIPYYVTSRFLRIFLEGPQKPKMIVILIQKEVAQRICAKRGEHSLLSLSVQYYGKPKIINFVSKSAFYPEPKIDSAILKIEVFKKSPCQVEDEKQFFEIMRAAFKSRRKQLHNSLSKNLKISQEVVKNILKKCQISPLVRPQDLGLNDFKNLYQAFRNANFMLIHKEFEEKGNL